MAAVSTTRDRPSPKTIEVRYVGSAVEGEERAGVEEVPCVISFRVPLIRARLDSKGGDERGNFSRQVRSGSGSGSRRWARGVEWGVQVKIGLGS
jgi:hypothetical protein